MTRSASTAASTRAAWYASGRDRRDPARVGEAQFTGLRYFALDGTDHPDHATQGRMIHRFIAWRNRNAHDRHLRRVSDRANVA